MEDEIPTVDEKGGVTSLPDRKLILEATEILHHQMGMDPRSAGLILSALRLGFAIGTDDNPKKYVPAVALVAAQAAAEEAKKYREREHQALNEAGVTRAIARNLGQFGGGGLW